MPSDLAGVFSELTLIFSVPGSYVEDGTTGNTVQGPASTVEIRAWLKATRDASIQRSVKSQVELEGAGIEYLTLTGRCVDPISLPSTIKAGMECPLTLGGVEGTFTLAPRTPSLLQEVADSLGQTISGIWEAH